MRRYLVKVKQILKETVIDETEDDTSATSVTGYWTVYEDEPKIGEVLTVDNQSFEVVNVICECD